VVKIIRPVKFDQPLFLASCGQSRHQNELVFKLYFNAKGQCCVPLNMKWLEDFLMNLTATPVVQRQPQAIGQMTISGSLY